MPNYNPSTIARIGDLVNGIRVDTGSMAAETYMVQTQQEIFNVYGRIHIHYLFGEVTEALSAQATTILYNWTSTTPAVAVQPLSAASGSTTGLAVGERMTWQGGAVATAVTLTATPTITDVLPASGQIVGVKDGVGTIGILTGTASHTDGTVTFSIFYTPMSDGAYVTAVH